MRAVRIQLTQRYCPHPSDAMNVVGRPLPKGEAKSRRADDTTSERIDDAKTTKLSRQLESLAQKNLPHLLARNNIARLAVEEDLPRVNDIRAIDYRERRLHVVI